MSHHEHESQFSSNAVSCAIITCSDTRTVADDTSGALVRSSLESRHFNVLTQVIVRDEASKLEAAIRTAALKADAILITGGTGLAARDITPDVVAELADRELPGFGELFRHLSFAEIGAAAMTSRASAWVVGRVLVFAMPGSTQAVRLAMDQLIIPQLRHLVGLIRGRNP